MKKFISLFLSAVMAVSMLFGMNLPVYAEDINYAQQLIDMIENCNLKNAVYPAYDNKEQMDYMKKLALQIKENSKSLPLSSSLNSEERIVAAVAEYVNDNMVYSYNVNHQNGWQALMNGRGNCMDYSLLCFELCRFAGIEAYEIDATNRGHQLVLVHCEGRWRYLNVTGVIAWYTVDNIKTSSCNPNGEPFEPTAIRTHLFDLLYSTHLDPTVQKYFNDNEKILCYSTEHKDIRYMNKKGEVLGVPASGWKIGGPEPYKYENGKLYLNEEYYYKGIRYRGFRIINSKEYCFYVSGANFSPSIDYSHIYTSPNIQFGEINCAEGKSAAVQYTDTVLNSDEPYEIGLISRSNPKFGNYECTCYGDAVLSEDGKTITGVKWGTVYLVVASKITGEVLTVHELTIDCTHKFEAISGRDATCYRKGFIRYVCRQCGEEKYEDLPMIEHNGKWSNEYGYLVKRCVNEGCYETLSRLPFEDIEYCTAYGDYIEYTSVSNKFITGTNPPYNTLFSPTAPITRAMFVTILYRMAGSPYDNGKNPYDSNPFSDVPENAYYYNPACWALNNGITNQTVFKPYDNVSREQTASFLFRYAQNSGYIKDEQYKTADLTGFYDYADVRDWALEALQWANYNGMITGTVQNTLNPQGATQRVHATKILYGFGKVCGIGNFA